MATKKRRNNAAFLDVQGDLFLHFSLKSCVVSARGFVTTHIDGGIGSGTLDRNVFASRGRGDQQQITSSSLNSNRLNSLNVSRQRVRGLIRNFTSGAGTIDNSKQQT